MDKKDLSLAKFEALLQTNSRLNGQIKDLTKQNEKLQEAIRDLEEQISEIEQKTAQKGDVVSVRRNGITVLYIHFEGFKQIKEGSSTHSFYDLLDEIQVKFDEIAARHKLERIRLIGDDYVCAGGITEKRSTNPVDIALAALAMRHFIDEFGKKHSEEDQAFWELKIGIHSGNGTVEYKEGKRNKTFNLTGEVINTASRVSDLGEPGQIIISDYTYEIIKSYFQCEYSGELPVKYRGAMGLYNLKRIKRMYSVDRKLGLKPNDEFMVKYHLKEFNDLEEKVLNFLQKNLPEHLYYHDYRHTIDVVNQAELIGYGEGVTDEEILLLKTAALFHDTGHTISSPGHEELGCGIAREWLTAYNYSEKQIEKICEIIMATKMPPNPQTLLQKIICDSDLDYLGRIDFIPTSNALFRELEAQGIISDINEWNKLQIKFLSAHQFYTDTSQRLREVNKQSQIDRIQKLIVE